MSVRTLAKNAALSIVAHILARGSLVFASIFLARSIETHEFAAYSYFQLTVSMLAAYSALGLGATASKFFAEAAVCSADTAPPIGTLWLISICSGLFLGLIVCVLPREWVDGGLDISPVLLAIGVVSVSLGVIPSGGVVGLERFKASMYVAALSAVVLIIGSIFSSYYRSLFLAMLVFVLASLIQAIGNSFVVFSTLRFGYILELVRFGKKDLLRIASFAGPMVGVSLLAASGSWVVGRLILEENGHQSFALYSIGLQWYALALFIPGMVARVLLPRLVKNKGLVSAKERKKLVATGALLATGAALAVSIVGGFLSPWLLHLYGQEYAVNRWLIGVFLFSAIPLAPANTLGNAILSDDGQRSWLALIALSFVCMTSAAVFLTSYGAFGGAISHALSSFLLSACAFFVAKHRGLL